MSFTCPLGALHRGADFGACSLAAAGVGCLAAVLLGRAGTPDEVATVVAFLDSPDASFLTGETIEINGGMNMR